MDSQGLFSDQEIQDILDKDLLELMGAKDMPQEQKADLYTKMAQTVEDRVIMRIDDQLDDTSRAEFIKLIEAKDNTKTDEFLRTKNIDVSQLLAAEAMIYKTEIMTLYKQGRKQE